MEDKEKRCDGRYRGGVQCSVSTCRNLYYKTIGRTNPVSYFKFPKNPKLRKIWAEKCKRKDFVKGNGGHVCSDHFAPDDFERDLKAELMGTKLRRRLKPNAVPSLLISVKKEKDTSKCTTNRTMRQKEKERKALVKSLLSLEEPDPIENIMETIIKVDFKLPDSPDPIVDSLDETSIKDISDVSPKSKRFKPCSSTAESPCIRNCTVDLVSPELSERLPKILSSSEMEHEKFLKKIKELEDKCEGLVSTNKELSKKVTILETHCETLKEEINDTKEKAAKEVEVCETALAEYKSALLKVFTTSQVELIFGYKKQVKEWPDKDIGIAFAIRYFSKKCFDYLYQNIHFPLPSVSSLRNWASTIEVRSGILNGVFSLMKIVGLSLIDSERLTVLSFDEMKVAELLEYDKSTDEVVGPFSKIFVIMARGLFKDWKQPIYVNFDVKMSTEMLLPIIDRLKEINYNVAGIVCDSSNSSELWSELNVTYEEPFFIYDNAKICCFTDTPNVLVHMRNHFNEEGFTIDRILVTKILINNVIEERNDSELSSKLSRVCMNVQKLRRQNVKLASELFSKSTASALKQYDDDDGNEIERLSLAEFIDVVYVWYNMFRGKSEDSEIQRFVCSSEQSNILVACYETIKSMRVGNYDSLLPFQEDILMNINSLLEMFNYLKDTYGIKYVHTYKLNLDCLENLFFQLRQKDNRYYHPTPLDALHCLRMVMFCKNLKGINKITDTCEEEFIVGKVMQKVGIEISVEPASDMFSTIDSYLTGKNINSTIIEEINQDNLIQLADWISNKFKKKFPSLAICNRQIYKDGHHDYALPRMENSLWTDFEGLTEASPLWKKAVENMEAIIQNYFPENDIARKSTLKNLILNCKNEYFDMPIEAVKAFLLQRIHIRIHFLNAINDVGKQKRIKRKKIV